MNSLKIESGRFQHVYNDYDNHHKSNSAVVVFALLLLLSMLHNVSVGVVLKAVVAPCIKNPQNRR